MDTLKLFWKIIKKNKMGIIIYTAITIVMLFVLSNSSFKSGKSTYEKTNIPFSVVDNDNSELSRSMIKSLARENMLVECDSDISKIRNSLFYRKMYYVLFIPKGYQDRVMAGEKVELENVKVNDSAMSYYMEMNVNEYISIFESYMKAGFDLGECIDYTDETLKEKAEVSLIDLDVEGTYNKSYYYYNMLAYILIAIIITVIAPVLVAVNKESVRRRINCSPVKFTRKNMEYGMAAFLFSAIIWLIVNALGIVINMKDLNLSKILLHMSNSFCLLLVAFSIGYLCGNLINNNDIITAMVNVISLGMSFLSGIFVPLEVLSKEVRQLARIFPAYWYSKVCAEISKNAHFDKEQLKELTSYMGIELVFAFAIFVISLVAIKKFRVRE